VTKSDNSLLLKTKLKQKEQRVTNMATKNESNLLKHDKKSTKSDKTY